MTIRFFGSEDRQGKKLSGAIRSEYPTWYHPVRVEMLQEEVQKGEHQIKSGVIDKLPNTEQFRNELDRKRALLDQVLESKPILNGKDKDRAANAYHNLGDQIKALMPTRSEMLKGLANAHDENRKDHNNCVNIEGMVDLVRECGVPVEKNQKTISRKQAARAWKILGGSLGERSNVEYLRRDRNNGTYHGERSIDEMIREDS